MFNWHVLIQVSWHDRDISFGTEEERICKKKINKKYFNFKLKMAQNWIEYFQMGRNLQFKMLSVEHGLNLHCVNVFSLCSPISPIFKSIKTTTNQLNWTFCSWLQSKPLHKYMLKQRSHIKYILNILFASRRLPS